MIHRQHIPERLLKLPTTLISAGCASALGLAWIKTTMRWRRLLDFNVVFLALCSGSFAPWSDDVTVSEQGLKASYNISMITLHCRSILERGIFLNTSKIRIGRNME